MNRSAAISFLGINEAKNVDLFSFELRTAPLSSTDEFKGIALILLLLLLDLFLFLLLFLSLELRMSRGSSEGGERNSGDVYVFD